MLQAKTRPTGGQFLLEAVRPDDVFTPEDFDETQTMIADTVREFVERSVKPHIEAYEYGKKVELNIPMLRAAGMSGAWFLAYLIPGLNILAQIIWCFKIVAAREKSVLIAIMLLLRKRRRNDAAG